MLSVIKKLVPRYNSTLEDSKEDENPVKIVELKAMQDRTRELKKAGR